MRLIDADELKKKLKLWAFTNVTTTSPTFDFVTEFDIDECPTVEPCEDAVSRDAVIDILGNYGCTNREGLLFKDIQALPSVTRQTGEWIKWWEVIKHERSEEYISRWKCSVCGKEQDPHSAKFINFCPNCGADMRGAE